MLAFLYFWNTTPPLSAEECADICYGFNTTTRSRRRERRACALKPPLDPA